MDRAHIENDISNNVYSHPNSIIMYIRIIVFLSSYASYMGRTICVHTNIKTSVIILIACNISNTIGKDSKLTAYNHN
jgi:hypothetical protein